MALGRSATILRHSTGMGCSASARVSNCANYTEMQCLVPQEVPEPSTSPVLGLSFAFPGQPRLEVITRGCPGVSESCSCACLSASNCGRLLPEKSIQVTRVCLRRSLGLAMISSPALIFRVALSLFSRTYLDVVGVTPRVLHEFGAEALLDGVLLFCCCSSARCAC